jgi:hypothetical protein
MKKLISSQDLVLIEGGSSVSLRAKNNVNSLTNRVDIIASATAIGKKIAYTKTLSIAYANKGVSAGAVVVLGLAY